MKRFWLIRGATLGTSFVLISCALLPGQAAESGASWTDSQTGTAKLVALTVPGVTGLYCRNIYGSPPSAQLHWEADEQSGVTVKYEVTSKSSNGRTKVDVVTTNSYTYNSSLIEALLGALLTRDATIDAYVRTIYEFPVGSSQWKSVTSEVVKINFEGSLVGLGGGFNCVPRS